MHALKIVFLTSVLTVSGLAVAVADDAPSGPAIKTPKQQMNECMADQRATHSDRTVKAMRKACEAQQQTLQNHPSIPTPPARSPQT